MKKHNRYTPFLILTASLCGGGLSAQTLLYEYTFDDVGNTTSAVSTGSNAAAATFHGGATRGASGTGVSGAVGDYAFDLTAPDAMGNNATTNINSRGDVSTGATGFNGSTSMTISGWYNSQGTAGGFARLVQIGSYDSVILTGSDDLQAGVRLGNGSSGTQQLDVTDTLLNTSNEWLFFAVTYDGTTGGFSIYGGSTTDSVKLLGSTTLAADTIYTNFESVNIGNSSDDNRPFDGLIDDIRIYTDGGDGDASGALSLSALEGLRTSSIPEPGTAALAAGIGVLLVAMLRRRQ